MMNWRHCWTNSDLTSSVILSRTTAISPWFWRKVVNAVQRATILTGLILPAFLLTLGCAEKRSQVEVIRDTGMIHVVTNQAR